MKYILAIDEGTSSTRAMLYTSKWEVAFSSQYPLSQTYPSQGWVEQDPEEIWEKTLAAIRDVVGQVASNDIVACGLTNQRETTVLWNKATSECVGPAIVWQDRRTDEYCKTLQKDGELIRHKTGLLPDPYFSASKIHWLLENIPKARQLAKKGLLAFGTMDSYIMWRLSKGRCHRTDITNASRTILYNIINQKWDEELLDIFQIPHSILPEVMDSDAHFCDISKEFFGYSIPITGVAGDQQASMIGQSCFNEGMIKATYGTGGFLLLNTGLKPVFSTHRLLSTIAYRIQGETIYGLEGSLYQAGTSVKWLRDEMLLIKNVNDTDRLARSLKSNEGVYFIPSFTGLGAPHWLTTHGAALVGLSQKSNAAHIARAVLESVCYQTLDVLTCMQEDYGSELSLLRVDGGMANNAWLLEYLSSQCNLIVQRPKNIETTAMGVAMLASIGCGEVTSLSAVAKLWRAEHEYHPVGNKDVMNTAYQGWINALRAIK